MKYRVVFDDFKTFEEDGYPNEFQDCVYISKDGRIGIGKWTKGIDYIDEAPNGYFRCGGGVDFEEDLVAWSPVHDKEPQSLDDMLDIKEGATVEEYVSVMTDALQEAMQVQKKYEAALKELADENQFLADVITENKLARKVVEKRKQREQAKEIFNNNSDKEDENLSLAERIERAKKGH